MKTLEKKFYCRNKRFVWKEVDGIVHILDHRNATIHSLNATASWLWKLLKSRQSISEMTTLLSGQFEVNESTAQSDIEEFVNKYLKEEYLIIKKTTS